MNPPSEIRHAAASDGQVSVLDLIAVLLRRWKTIVFTTLAAVALAALGLFLLPTTYVAQTVLVPAAERGNTGSVRAQLMSQMPNLPLTVGAGGGQQRLIEVVLRSRSLADSMVARIRAQPQHRDVEPGEIREILATGVDLQGDAVLDGSVAVKVTAEEPALAADVANEFPPLINGIAASLGAQLAQRKEQFIEAQLAAAAERLAESEARMVRFEKGSDAVDLQEQGKRTVEAASRLQEAVTQQELRVAAIRRTATPNNPELRAAEGELAARRRALAELTGGGRGNNALYVPLGQSSDLKVAATRVMRDFARDEQIYKALTAALTQARMDASDNLPIVGVLDTAATPTAPASKSPLTVLLAATLAGLFLGLLFAFIAEYLRRMRSDPAGRDFLAAMGGENGRSSPAPRFRVTETSEP